MASIDPLLPLSGRAVVLTGGARRVGATLARALNCAGANLVLNYRGSRDEAAPLSTELTASRPRSVALVQADLL
ncbi:MAG: hypothetical protein ACT4O5_06650, partial [Gammaproteobacteria bacterium]